MDQTDTAVFPPDWYPDPLERHEYRYWDGAAWTENVASGGNPGLDPIWTLPASTTLEEYPVSGEALEPVEAAAYAGGYGGAEPTVAGPATGPDLAFGGGANPPPTTGDPGAADPPAHAADPPGYPPTEGEGGLPTEAMPGAPPVGGFSFLDPQATEAPAPPAVGGPTAAQPLDPTTGRATIGRHDAGTGPPGAGGRDGGTHARPRTVPVRRPPSKNRAFVLILAGGLLAVLLGVYGSVHNPGAPRYEPPFLGFDNFLKFKVWMTTVFLALAVVQALISARMYGKVKVPKRRPRWLGDAHRLIGTLVLLISLPIAYHCLWIFGFKSTNLQGDTDVRVLIHSVAGCAFYGAYLTKVLSVRVRRLPRWMLPYAGGAVFATLVLLFATSSAYVFINHPGSVF